MESKNKIRQKILKTRNSLPVGVRQKKSGLIIEKLGNLKEFQKAKDILFYYAVNSEAETLPLIEKHFSEKRFYLPVIKNQTDFRAVRLNLPFRLKQGKSGVPEPKEGDEATHLDLIIIPGVAFDKAGNRLGMGKGYYDRFLKHYPGVLKIALSYHEQMVENIPVNEYDVPADLIITDQNIYDLR